MKVAKPAEKSWSSPLAETLLPVGNVVPFHEQIQHFVRVVRGTEEPRCTGTDGLRALRVCEAIREAMNRGTVVEIEN